MADIDRLEVEIQAQATKANNALDNIINKLERVSNSLSGVNGKSLSDFAQGIEKIAGASAQLSNIKTADFTRLATNIKGLSSLNSKEIYGASQAMRTMANSLNSFGKVSANGAAIADLASGISKLGNKSVASAISNMPKLATSLNSMMGTLSKAPAVSQNLIQMTNALANLASQGSKVGTTSNSLVGGLNKTSSAMQRTRRHSMSLAAAFGKFYASWWLAVRGAKKIFGSIQSSMNYVETLNYFDAAFEQVAGNAVSQWETAGYDSAESYYKSFSARAKELTGKMTGFSISENGMLTETGAPSLGIDPGKLMNYQAMFAQMSSSIGVTSETSLKLSQALTEIGADLASVKNMDFDKVWKDMASGLAGMSRTLDKYGVNIRNVNLQQKLTELGIKANIQALNQNEKALLRGIILLDSTKYAWGDLADTLNQPANQLRLLSANFGNLARAIGNLFLPVVAKVLPYINGLVIALQRLVSWVGSLLGIDISKITSSVGSGSDDLSDFLDSADGASDALGSAADNAKKLKNITMGIDELNIVSQPDDSGSGSGAGSGIGGGLLDDAFLDAFDDYQKAWDKAFAGVDNRAKEIADRIVDAFKRGDWYGIGEYISTSLRDALNRIPWETVYDGARKFWTGLAQFMNGLIRPDTFYAVGKTIAGALNTAIYAALAFGEEFDFKNFGESIAAGINGFFENFDFKSLARTLNVWVKGLFNTVRTALKKIKWSNVWNGIKDFLSELEVDTVAILIGGFALMHSGKYLTGTVLKGIISKKFADLLTSAFGTGTLAGAQAISAGFAIGATVYVSFKFAEDAKKWWGNIKELGWDAGRKKTADENAANPYIDDSEYRKTIDSMNEKWNEFWRNIREKASENGANPYIEDSEYNKKIYEMGASWDNLRRKLAEENPANPYIETSEYNRKIDEMREKWNEFGESVKTVFSSVGERIAEWWTESVAPWFTSERWYELGQGILDGICLKWEEFKIWWQESALLAWWEENVVPWFSLETWYTLADGMLQGISTKWDEQVKLWTTNITKWWNTNVAPWFTVAKWQALGENLKNGVFNGFKGIAQKTVDVLNSIISAFESMVNKIVDKVNDLIEKINDSLGPFIPNIPTIKFKADFGRIPVPQFENGGFPASGEMFLARENGINEYVGRIGNRSAVANNDQIVEGVARGVASGISSANDTQNELLREQNELLRMLLEKDVSLNLDDRDIFKASERGRKSMGLQLRAT